MSRPSSPVVVALVALALAPLLLGLMASSGLSGWETTTGNHLRPIGDGTQSLGDGSHRVSGVYLGGLIFNGTSFATLGAPSNGVVYYCIDCNATCSAGGSTGRICARINGAWAAL